MERARSPPVRTDSGATYRGMPGKHNPPADRPSLPWMATEDRRAQVSELRLTKFKSFSEQVLPIGDFTLIVGRNGAGSRTPSTLSRRSPASPPATT